ncbi:hemin-degrading factor [Pararhizobium sp.]|uniref:hemin-degrading factor n=1 Tax=Pararhizobium sp. TaxID=1977563 RepID=UPI002719E4EF|nr:ChuX/HutX family heme-like substrate-binding protein [Pararhizobium sp.]MDO9414968.1 ChuX/HutX family heme-like substrate-binding protein [Pararhizobium sp.]
MTDKSNPTPADIRAFRAENPKMRERDIAAQLGVSEGALVAAECGLTAIRIDGSANKLLEHVASLGEVMALTRNESAVHEKIGTFEKISMGPHSSIVLGSQIDQRIFPSAWCHGFAVTKTDADHKRLSLQYFDKAGTAVHKVHLRPESNVEAYHTIVDTLRLEDQSQEFHAEAIDTTRRSTGNGPVDTTELRDRWSKMTDTHQFFGILKKLNIARHDAIKSIGEDYAWQLAPTAVEDMMRASAKGEVPIMVFVGNHGIIQIHGGPVSNIQPMGPWLNVMDPTFHLHLRTDHIAEIWAVRKPTADGHVTSLEVYDAAGEMIIQYFGKRKEGVAEREEWRAIMEALPRATSVAA